MSRSRSPRARSERPLTDEPSYEELERELVTIVTRLEQGQVSLDEAIALWERGEQLYKLCVGKLDSAQGRIEELAKRVESANPSG
jgi:exodeoxyribonuclease VII small subunit